MLEFNQWGIPMLPIHDSFLVSLRYEGDLLLAMRQAMKKHSGIDVPIKNATRSISNLTAQLSKHWEQYDQYDPSQDHNQEPELTGLFVSGYEGYQKRVGDMVREKHRRTFG